jgi:hypothetical protein
MFQAPRKIDVSNVILHLKLWNECCEYKNSIFMNINQLNVIFMNINQM